MLKFFYWCICVLAAGVTAALIYAPYLPQLIAEGVPGVLYTGKGHFAELGLDAEPAALSVAPDATSRPLLAPVSEIFAQEKGEALLVYRDGQLALEHYANGTGPETKFNSFSMAKSLVGGLVFKALAEGRIANLDQHLSGFLPEAKGIGGVTLRNLLAMRSGIRFDDGGSFGSVPGKAEDTTPNPFGALARLHFTGLAAVAPTLSVDPAQVDQFSYENVNTALLGAVVEKAFGMPLGAVLDGKLWSPAGAGPAMWRARPGTDEVSAYCCIYATARDWIRVGRYINSNGTPGAPFLPEPLWRGWLGLDVAEATRSVNNYGLHVWQNVLDRPRQDLQGPFSYFMGQFGQTLYLMPDKGLVVYRAGEGIPLLHSTLYGAWNSSERL
jgi:CubicO group peptidase (beta-lactamase class C family)